MTGEPHRGEREVKARRTVDGQRRSWGRAPGELPPDALVGARAVAPHYVRAAVGVPSSAMANAHAERRIYARSEVELSASVERVGGRAGLTGPATTLDLSEGGVRLKGPLAFAVGDVVRVTITSGDLSVAHQGLVVGRQAGASKQATINVAFRTPDERTSIDLRRLMELAA